MTKLLKAFARGIGYFFVLPILVIVLSIFSIVGIFIFIYVGIKAIILFFTGRNIFGDFPEDIEAKRRMQAKKEQYAAASVTAVPEVEDIHISPSPQQTVEQPHFEETTIPTQTQENSQINHEEPNNNFGDNQQ